MKKSILFLLSVCLFSCSQEDKLKSRMEDYLVQNLNNPKSYERIEIELDTAFLVDDLKSLIKVYEKGCNHFQEQIDMMRRIYYNFDSAYNEINYKADIDSSSLDLYKRDLSLYNSRIDSLNKEISNTNPNDYRMIYGNIKYRAQNKFGAVVISTTQVNYNPKEDKIVSLSNVD